MNSHISPIKKTIYFVRHGITGMNALRIYQVPTTPLSQEGLAQAELIAARVKNLGAEVVVTSTMTRAKQTAEAIVRHTSLPIVESMLFQEIIRPTELRGKSPEDEEVKAIKKTIREHSNDPVWHYSDEENRSDLIARAKNALAFLIERPEKSIIVTTHGEILRYLLAKMVHGSLCTPAIVEGFSKGFAVSNTGLSVVQYEGDGNWYVKTWNDYAHLGE